MNPPYFFESRCLRLLDTLQMPEQGASYSVRIVRCAGAEHRGSAAAEQLPHRGEYRQAFRLVLGEHGKQSGVKDGMRCGFPMPCPHGVELHQPSLLDDVGAELPCDRVTSILLQRLLQPVVNFLTQAELRRGA